MSAVLRKKIEAGAGIPPSILQMQTFWEQLLTKTADWAAETFSLESTASLASRRAIGGRTASALIDNPFTFFFPADISPGLCAIAMDAQCAAHCAAARMHQDVSSLEGASSLFMKLLCEQPSTGLWQRIAAGLTAHNTKGRQTPQSDAPSIAGGLDDASRYVEIQVALPLGEHVSTVTYLFQLDFLQRQARTTLQTEVARKAQACSQSPKSLSDSVRASAIPLDAGLDRLVMTIGECSQLEVGRILPLASADAGRLSLSAETINGSVDIGAGELGVWKRQRAVKLHIPISESFAREILEL